MVKKTSPPKARTNWKKKYEELRDEADAVGFNDVARLREKYVELRTQRDELQTSVERLSMAVLYYEEQVDPALKRAMSEFRTPREKSEAARNHVNPPPSILDVPSVETEPKRRWPWQRGR